VTEAAATVVQTSTQSTETLLRYLEIMDSPAEAEQISSDEEIEAAATVVQGANDDRIEIAAATLFDLPGNVIADSAPTADANTG